MKKCAVHNPKPKKSFYMKTDYYGEPVINGDVKQVTKRWHRAQNKEICREAFECVIAESEDTIPKRK